MKVHFVSLQKKGSWNIRVEQIAQACDWTYSRDVDLRAILASDVVVGVKRVPTELREVVRAAGKPYVYDVIDSWGQPCNDVKGDREAIQRRIDSADAVIYANAAMARDFPHPMGRVIYHHYRPDIDTKKIRASEILRVGYEGDARYLGEWEPIIETHCSAIGAEFFRKVNKLVDVDIAVAVRAPPFDDILSRTYKSNVKMANVIGSGMPFLFFPEPSYLETCPPSLHHWFFRTSHEFYVKLKELRSTTVRRTIHETLRTARPAFHISSIAAQYRAFLADVLLDHQNRQPEGVAGGCGGARTSRAGFNVRQQS